jgi:serine/threonine-protein kinase
LYIWTFGRADLKSIASAHEELNIALRLDPQLPAARFLRANMAIVDWDWAAAKSQLEQMRAAGMHDAGVLIRSGQLARAFGQSEQAVDYFIQGLKLDPLAVIYHVQLAMAYQALGRAADCRAAAETALSISPTTVKAHLMIGLTELDAGHLDAARAQMEQENGEYYRLEGLSMVAFAQKRKEESDAALAKLISSYQDNAGVQIAQVYAYRAERDKAFEWLERSIAQKDPGMVNLKTDPLLANLRSDPRFKALLRKMNLPV